MQSQLRRRAAPLRKPRELVADRRGNVLAMTAAAIVPLIAMIGGAIDLTRLYMTQTRLQQACDAGALAGRRSMADVNVLTTTDDTTAQKFFKFNMPAGTYGAGNATASYARGTPGTVVGQAAIDAQTTIMRFFGYGTYRLNVTCEATLVVPNTDVMFVLDVTGSMAQVPTGDTVSKLDGLKQAVKSFYGALGPGVATGPGRVRYGFMPYSSNVNVGKIVYNLNHSYLAGGTGAEQWTYQSRVAVTAPENYVASYGAESGQTYGAPSDGSISWSSTWYNQTTSVGYAGSSYSNVTSYTCNNYSTPNPSSSNSGSPTGPNGIGDETPVYPDATQTRYYSTTQRKTVRRYDYFWSANYYGASTGTCQLKYNDGTYTTTTPSTTSRPINWATRDKFVRWNYQQASFDTSYVVQNATAANPTYYTGYWATTDPNINRGYNANGYAYSTATPSTMTWSGCIEEAGSVNTISPSSSINVPDDAYDLNIDLIPSSTATRWKPFLPQVQFDRSAYWLGRNAGWIDSGFAACPREASPLTQYASDYVPATKSSATFASYVDSLTAVGGTYHDIGLIWGARFLSPDGIFAASNRDAVAPGGFQVSRHIVFMTDGTLDTRAAANDPWGINTLDGRIAATSADDDAITASHSRRVDILCNAMRGKGFTIWVVGFGITTLPQQLQDCASDANHWSVSSNSTQLSARFQTIAQTIGGLRLSQ
jgi:Flp pilus assembly protein TadG